MLTISLVCNNSSPLHTWIRPMSNPPPIWSSLSGHNLLLTFLITGFEIRGWEEGRGEGVDEK